MPSYDYCCDANGRVVEARHPMNELLTTWGELCERAGLEPGDTPAATPVRKLISGSGVVRSASLGSAPPCESGPCCGDKACGMG